MYCFMKFDSPSKSDNYDKGILFEKLCRDLLDVNGYNKIEMRVKANNLEYDIIANNQLTNQKIIGEAKAWDKKISSEIMAFIAKMMHFWLTEPNDWGMFISLSELTSDVKQQVDDLKNAGYNITYIVGNEIMEVLVAKKNYISVKQLKKIVECEETVVAGDTYFLVSDRGYYYIQLLIKQGMTLPTHFCCYDMYGKIINDQNFIEILETKLELVKELKYYGDKKAKVEIENVETAFLGVVHGEGWFDYQFPANPEKFIGRSTVIESVDAVIRDVKLQMTNTKVIEILSRSGVGKSSLALKLQYKYEKESNSTVLVDSRNIRTDIDILQVFQLIVMSHNNINKHAIDIPTSKEDIVRIGTELDEFNIKMGRISLVIFDQFESIFARTTIFNSIMDLILEFNVRFKSFVFIIARKNDQPTTYDESALIDLNRLKSISKPVVLEDFKTEEATELISHISDEIGSGLIKQLKEQVLEISNGFPWLLKKYCAHIISLVNNGEKQKNIVNTGMQLEDLFNEDILALEETTRDFFYRIIPFLPATFAELSEIFDDEDLTIKLRILQNDYRLIRLTGRTFDTYNDILKEYIKTGHINLSKRFLIRFSPNTVLKLYKFIVVNQYHSVGEIVSNSKTKKSSIVNTLGELKKLKLIEGKNDNFSYNGYALQFYEEENIINYISNILKENILVKRVIQAVEIRKQMTYLEVRDILVSEMPFIEATEKIWDQYALTMCKWMSVSNLVSRDKNGIHLIDKDYDSKNTLFSDELFFPSTMILQIVKVVAILERHREGKTIQNLKKEMKRTSLNGHLGDALFLDLVNPISRSEYEISKQGIAFLKMNDIEKSKYVEEKILSLPYVREYLKRIEVSSDDPLTVFSNLLMDLHIEKWNPSSVHWKHKILRNWLIYSGLVVGKTHHKRT